MARVLITGITGQDGAFLARDLIKKGFKVFGTLRRGGSPKSQKLKQLNILNKIKFEELELTEFANVFQVVKKIKPDFIYNLASQNSVNESYNHPHLTNSINYQGTLNLLEAIKLNNKDTNFFQASSSEMFGENESKKNITLNENSSFNPLSPYAISKLSSHFLTVTYRRVYGINCSSGILFNHESEIRGFEYVTRKISSKIAKIKLGDKTPLKIGSLESSRDWGYAPEYVKAMQLMNESKNADDFIISTNKKSTVRDFLKWSCNSLGFKVFFDGAGLNEKCIDKKTGKIIAVVNKEFYRKIDAKSMKGNNSKIYKKLRWKPKVFSKQISEIMTINDYNLLK